MITKKKQQLSEAQYEKWLDEPTRSAQMFLDACGHAMDFVEIADKTFEFVDMIKAYGESEFNEKLECACYGGNLNRAEWLIQHCANVDWGLRGACRGGNVDAARWAFVNWPRNFDEGLTIAYAHGHIEIMKLLRTWGAKLTHLLSNDRDRGVFRDLGLHKQDKDTLNAKLRKACRDNNIELARLLIANGADAYGWNIREISNRNSHYAQLLVESNAHTIILIDDIRAQ